MAHEIDFSNNRANIAFVGDRADIWHRHGTAMPDGASIEEWAALAGLEWKAEMVEAYHMVAGAAVEAAGHLFVRRNDTNAILGHASDRYQPVQPAEVLAWFKDYILTDDRFTLDVAGCLRGGAVIWATAKFNGPMDVAGSEHTARVLMTTSFDGSKATTNQATMTRTVCMNTLRVAMFDKRAVVKTRHNTKFNAAKAAAELGELAKSFEGYRAMGEALAMQAMAREDVSRFFKKLLDIPFDVPAADIPTRTMNRFEALSGAYVDTVKEGTEAGTKWTALNAVTRYADHEQGTRGSSRWGSEDVARFYNANFGGSGDQLKARAVELLMADGSVGKPLPASLAALV